MDGLREPQTPSGVCNAEGSEPGELLDRIRRGDADAFEHVAREHAPRLFRLAYRLTGRREDAEDLVQETLVRTLPKLRRFEGRAKLSTYLVRALTNLWKNRIRSRSITTPGRPAVALKTSRCPIQTRRLLQAME